MHGKGKIPGEEGFLRGSVFARKRGSESFWGKCFKRIRVSDNASFKKKSRWEENGGTYTTVILPIYTDDSIQNKLYMHGKGKIPQEEGFLRGSEFARKRGSESFWGRCLK